jgi:hypothetical protein
MKQHWHSTLPYIYSYDIVRGKEATGSRCCTIGIVHYHLSTVPKTTTTRGEKKGELFCFAKNKVAILLPTTRKPEFVLVF